MNVADFQLTDGDKISPTWLRLKAHLQSKLDEERRKNDDPKLDHIQTAVQRGRIQMLKGLLDLGEDRPLTGD